MRITNSDSYPIVVWLEPFGADYWILPGDTLDFTPEAPQLGFYFHMKYRDRDITLFAEGRYRDVHVLHDGTEVECGFNRSKRQSN